MDPWVGDKETQPELDPLPFLTGNKARTKFIYIRIRDRERKEKNKREESFREKRRGWCVELSWRPVCGGRSVEVGSKCGLMEASVCEME